MLDLVARLVRSWIYWIFWKKCLFQGIKLVSQANNFYIKRGVHKNEVYFFALLFSDLSTYFCSATPLHPYCNYHSTHTHTHLYPPTLAYIFGTPGVRGVWIKIENHQRVIFMQSSWDYSRWDYSSRDYLSRDYSSQDYSCRDYSSRDYSSQDYSSRDYSSRYYSCRDYSSWDYSSRDYSYKDY